MTNAIAILIVLAVLSLIVADHLWLQWQVPLAMARTLDGFIEYLSFWR